MSEFNYGDLTTRKTRAGNERQYRWLKCPECGIGKWTGITIQFEGDTAKSRCFRCGSLAAFANKGYKPYQKKQNKLGYVFIFLPANDPYYGMVTARSKLGGFVAEHRWVMAKQLGRLLKEGENVHHRNGKRNDNRPDNLELWLAPQPYGQRQDEWLRDYLDCMEWEQIKSLLQQTKHASQL